MWDLLFGIHIVGWKATFQFAFWTAILVAIIVHWLRREKN